MKIAKIAVTRRKVHARSVKTGTQGTNAMRNAREGATLHRRTVISLLRSATSAITVTLGASAMRVALPAAISQK